VGVDFIVRTIQIMGQGVKLQVWDTAGQERFRSVTSAYYRGAMGAIVCYDCMDENTFNNAETWMVEFGSKAKDDAPMILVANKKDMFTESSSGAVSPERGMALAKKFNATFFEASAYSGENVYSLFTTVCERILV